MKCPICGELNHCEIDSKHTCWCFQAHIPKQLLESLPEKERGKACICKSCIDRHAQL